MFFLFFVIFFMGLIVVGKIDLVMVLVDVLFCELISVDLVLIYCGMDIGMVKFFWELLVCYLYCLIDICDLVESYLVVEFCVDVLVVMVEVIVCGRIFLLVGGIMFYYKVLFEGLVDMFGVDFEVCVVIEVEVLVEGWEVLYW